MRSAVVYELHSASSLGGGISRHWIST